MNSFLSTPSARRATQDLTTIGTGLKFLSTPSARRATILRADSQIAGVISIHALREEGDPACLRGVLMNRRISIHALREEGDLYRIHIL